MTPAQYDYFKTGGITEAELNAASTGAGANQVFQRGSVSASGDPALWAYFAAGDYLTFQNYSSNNEVRYDELRISTTSLDEAITGTPEPGAWAALVSGAFALAGLRFLRRRQS